MILGVVVSQLLETYELRLEGLEFASEWWQNFSYQDFHDDSGVCCTFSFLLTWVLVLSEREKMAGAWCWPYYFPMMSRNTFTFFFTTTSVQILLNWTLNKHCYDIWYTSAARQAISNWFNLKRAQVNWKGNINLSRTSRRDWCSFYLIHISMNDVSDRSFLCISRLYKHPGSTGVTSKSGFTALE